jgi:cytochrome c oxidase accessory protein FixG
MTNNRIQAWRRVAEAAQAVLLLGIPFVRIGGESALRFDISSLRLHIFGISLWMDEWFIVLIAVFCFTFLIIFVTQLFGRIWCGWLCPQTVLIDLTRFLDKAASQNTARRAAAYLLTLMVSVVVSADLIWYFVSPYDFFPALMNGTLGTQTWGFWLSLSAITFLNFAFLRHTWCATVCPYAKLQGALFDNRTMVIGFDASRKDECMNCRACVRVCPVNIDIRNGLQAACITCAECIDVCAERMGKNQKDSLIGYFFGSPGSTGSLIRTNVVMFGLLTLMSLVFFFYLSVSRNPLDLTVLPYHDFRARIGARHEIVNAFTLAIENRSRHDLELSMRVIRNGDQLKTAPRQIMISAGEYKRVPAYVFFAASDKRALTGGAEMILEAEKHPDVRVRRNLNLVLPEVP